MFLPTLEFYGVNKVRREYFLAQLFTDTDCLTKVAKDPKETFQTALDIWTEKRLNIPSDFRNFGEVVRQYSGSHRDLEKRLSWLSRLVLFVHLLK